MARIWNTLLKVPYRAMIYFMVLFTLIWGSTVYIQNNAEYISPDLATARTTAQVTLKHGNNSTVIIDGDDMLKTWELVYSGNGSQEDPYLIKDLVFHNLQSTPITIRNTTAHILIRNIVITNVIGAAIIIENTSNFTMEDIIIDNSTEGIIVINSTSGIISSVNVKNFTATGISVSKCWDLRIDNGTIKRGFKGIVIMDSYNITIADTISGRHSNLGIEVTRCNRITMSFCYVRFNNRVNIAVTASENVSISDVEISDSYIHGIIVDGCIGLTITNTRFEDCPTGIYTTNAHNVTIQSNSFYNVSTGVYIYKSENISINRNTMHHGNNAVFLDTSRYCNIIDNRFYGCGVYVVGPNSEDYRTHTIKNTTVDSRPILYIKDQKNILITEGDYAQIIISTGSNITIAREYIANVSFGVIAAFSSGIVLEDIVFEGIGTTAIEIYMCSNFTVRYSTFLYNIYDIMIYSSKNVSVTYCEFNMPDIYSIFIDADTYNVSIIGNNFFTDKNRSIVYSDTHEVIWNTSIGNYWSNFNIMYPNASAVNDTWMNPYIIDGTSGCYDPRPRVHELNGTGARNIYFTLEVNVFNSSGVTIRGNIRIYSDGMVLINESINGTMIFTLDPGIYIVFLQAEEYVDCVRSVEGWPFAYITINIMMKSVSVAMNGTVVVTVYDTSNNTIKNAVIVISGMGEPTGFTDETGRFSLELPPGIYTMICKKVGYYSSSMEFTIIGGKTIELTVVLEKLIYRITLRIYDSKGQPVDNATVKIYDSNGKMLGNGTTNSNGEVVISTRIRPITGYKYTILIIPRDSKEPYKDSIVIINVDDFTGILVTDKSVIHLKKPTAQGDNEGDRIYALLFIAVFLLVFILLLIYIGIRGSPRKGGNGHEGEGRDSGQKKGRGIS